MSNMYDFVNGKTWNPIGGECWHKCHYCYVSSLKDRFPAIKKKYSGDPYLDDKAFKSLGKGHFYFVGSMVDFLADNVPDWMIIKSLEHCQKYDNQYLLQTKNPRRFNQFTNFYPEKTILCTTIETNRYTGSRAPWARGRALAMEKLQFDKYVTIEPIMVFELDRMLNLIDIVKPVQVNIGANSNSKIKLPEPSPDKIKELIEELEKFTKVHLKPNLKRLMPDLFAGKE
jgi:DNA repair photolyase